MSLDGRRGARLGSSSLPPLSVNISSLNEIVLEIQCHIPNLGRFKESILDLGLAIDQTISQPKGKPRNDMIVRAVIGGLPLYDAAAINFLSETGAT